MRVPSLLSAYVVPGRVAPRVREAAMLGVTSVNQCHACARVHERWGRSVGLPVHDPLGFTRDEAAAYAYGQALALEGPRDAGPPTTLRARHRRELEAAAIMMQLANLAGNRFLPGPETDRVPDQEDDPDASPQIGGALAARAYDLVMGAADRSGLRRARERIAARASGDVLEIGIGTGRNLAIYPGDIALHAVDPSGPALAHAARRARRLGRSVTLTMGDAAALPYPDGSFDVVVGTFVLCSVGDVGATLREGRRVLRPGGTMRFLEHGRSRRTRVAWWQTRLAPTWSRATGGCRLDHDVRSAIESAGMRITQERIRGGGLLVEVVARVA
jgi:AhpD family alkylhydroperoxidase